MKIRRSLAIAVLALVGCASFVGYADPSAAATVPAAAPLTTNSHGAVGNAAKYAPYAELQATGDCVAQSALVAMSGLAGQWVASHAGVDAEAVKLGILDANDDGGSFDATNVKLFEHYGFKASAPKSTSRKTLMKDLSKGDAVQVAAYGGDLWIGVPVPGLPNDVWSDGGPPAPDHAVVVDAVNKTTYAVTITDTGVDETYTIPWTQFAKAWATGDYLAIVVSK